MLTRFNGSFASGHLPGPTHNQRHAQAGLITVQLREGHGDAVVGYEHHYRVRSLAGFLQRGENAAHAVIATPDGRIVFGKLTAHLRQIWQKPGHHHFLGTILAARATQPALLAKRLILRSAQLGSGIVERPMRIVAVRHDEPWLVLAFRGRDNFSYRLFKKRHVASEARLILGDRGVPLVVILLLVQVGEIVTILFEQIRQRGSDPLQLSELARLGLMAVIAGQHHLSRRRAERDGNVGVVKPESFRRQPVKVRRRSRHGTIIRAHGIPVHVIGGDQQDVRSG